MADGSKKKKTKPAANPARGFATVSLPKAVKTKDPELETSTEASGEVTPNIVPTVAEPSQDKTTEHVSSGARELHQLSPEELEAQLEASELQQFVEKYAVGVRKDSSRQVSRLETDKRVLRGQAEFLSVKDWLPEELMLQILDLGLEDYDSSLVIPKKQKSPVGDDLLSKVWALRLCLLDLDVPLERVNQALRHLISYPPSQDTASLVWGLADALEWLSLHCHEAELDEYDFEKPKATSEDEPGTFESPPDYADDARSIIAKRDSPVSDNAAIASLEDELEVSDVDSDVDPEELLSIYLRSKARLYELNPSAEKTQLGRRRPPPGKPNVREGTTQTAGEKKLLQKLQRIESDMLFDQREADALWAAQRTALARETAQRQRLQLADAEHKGVASEALGRPAESEGKDVSNEAEQLGLDLLKETEDEDVDLLGGMFSALPGIEEADLSNGTTTSGANVTVRDFGRATGMSPKRVLEEACKARDPQAKIAYKMNSPTTYASRHCLTISWAKQQDLIESSYLTEVATKANSRSMMFTMVGVATPDMAQSECYIATVALFLIFSGSPKEEKAHLRLPSTFRNLWDELALKKRDYGDLQDRDAAKELRALIDSVEKPEVEDEDDEVVFKAGSRNWSRPVSGTSTPAQREHDASQLNAVSQSLQELWARKTATPQYQRMLLARMNLPIFHFKTAALEAIERNQVIILVSETGSGKSTQLPAFILEHQLMQGRHCKVYCTEPRRISAISLAQRVSEEMGEHKGDVGTPRSLVGYAIRLESHTTPQTRLVYATTGIVLRMLENADGLKDITHLVIDEVHERSIDTDFLLIILRSLLQRRPALKVVLMSATVDAQKFSKFFFDPAPIIDVPGRTFPVQAKFLEDAIELTGHTNDDVRNDAVEDDDEYAEHEGDEKPGNNTKQLTGYSKRTVNTLAGYDEYRIDYSLIMKLLQKVAMQAQYQQFSKAVLIFLPGISEIRQLNDMLTTHPVFRQGWSIYPLHSSFSSEDQQAAFDIPPPGIRKIVLATNIAETGITIPDVTCVIDTGKHKEMRFDEKRQMSRLILSFIARANAKQRRGRAGRVQEGICFHLFTKQRHDEAMAENQTPEMLRLSLQDLVMRVKICKLGGIEHALSQALDPPSSRNIRRAIDALVEVGALTEREDLTPLGQQLSKLPLDAPLVHAKKQADTIRLGFKRGDSDLLTLYNAYCTWRKVCTTSGMSDFQFCNKNFLSSQNLANIEDLKGQLLSSLVEAGFIRLGPEERAALSKVRPGSRQRHFVALDKKYCKADDNDTIISSVVAWSFYPKIVKQEGKGWRNIANNQTLGLHPTSVNKNGLLADVKMLSFYSIMQSNSRFTNAQETTPVSEMALVLLAGDAVFHLYAGVIVIDGNRLRFKVRDWKTLIVLKILRGKLKEVLARLFKTPGRELTGKHLVWMEILERIMDKGQKS